MNWRVLISFSAVGLGFIKSTLLLLIHTSHPKKTHQNTLNKASIEKHLTTKPIKDHKQIAHQAKQSLLSLINHI